MITDLGTQHVNNLELVNQEDSTYINGFGWMKKDKRYFPVKIVYEIRLNKEELVAMQNKNLKYGYKNMPQEVECYKFSNYLIDANKGRFKSVVRIIAFMLKFVKNLRKKTRPLQDLKQMSKTFCLQIMN